MDSSAADVQWPIDNRQAEIMMRIASEFGFTPASRSRIATPSPAEPTLFDVMEDSADKEADSDKYGHATWQACGGRRLFPGSARFDAIDNERVVARFRFVGSG